MKPFDENTIAGITAWLEQEDDFVFLESARVSKENHQSLLFSSPRWQLVCSKEDDAVEFLAAADQWCRQGYYVAGWLGYEFGYLLEPCLRDLLAEKIADPGRPLAVLGVYDEPLVYDHAETDCTEKQAFPATEPGLDSFHCTAPQAVVSRSKYLEAVQKIKEYINAGDTYQVNYTLPLDFRFSGSVGALYRSLRRSQSVSYGAWIRQNGQDILSFSPELFFTASPDRIRVRPMKGTMARGRTTVEDAHLCSRLCADPKNRSENIMIVDLLRNDLGRLLHAGGGGRVVPRSLFDVETYESLLQMTSTIDGIPAEQRAFSLHECMTALFPCGSVTGAPKIRTMEIIHELEPCFRGVYCGAIGYAGLENSCFNVPIRTLELCGKQGRMGIGAGIVADSDPESEWQECLLKGNFLTRENPEFQLIETLLWQPDRGFFLLEYHLERLVDSSRYFNFSVDPDLVEQQLHDAVADCRHNQRVRLLLHRDGRQEISTVSLAESPQSSATAEVCLSAMQVQVDNPHLYHKTTRRSLFDREHGLAVDRGCLDVLFTNRAGEITEGAISNVFIRKKGQLLTPPVSCGLLAGTYRRMLLARGEASEQVLSVADLLAAEEINIANSVRGFVRVTLRLNDHD